MGVSGAGKTTVASELARELRWKYLDADSFHSAHNIAKMQAGIALDDADRAPWLAALRGVIEEALSKKQSLVLACSALKESYREQLLVSSAVRLVYLKASFELLRERLEQRTGHFVDERLLVSQLETLEEPRDAIAVDAGQAVTDIVAEIRRLL